MYIVTEYIFLVISDWRLFNWTNPPFESLYNVLNFVHVAALSFRNMQFNDGVCKVKSRVTTRRSGSLGTTLLAKEEEVLQDMTGKLIEFGRCYGMEMNVEKTKVMRISKQQFPVNIIIDQIN